MRKNFGPQSWLYPMPVLIIGTYDENGVPDAMNAAWGGMYNSNQIAVCIDKGHKTAANLLVHRAFTVSMADAAHVTECDYAGLVSGNKVPDKIEKTGFHIRESEFVKAPVFEELPMTLECRLISYDPETECAIGEILNVSAEERILGEDGKISAELLDPVTYDPVRHVYRRLGNIAGYAFSDGRKLM